MWKAKSEAQEGFSRESRTPRTVRVFSAPEVGVQPGHGQGRTKGGAVRGYLKK